MRFKAGLTLIACSALSLSSCGKFGQKDDTHTLFEYSSGAIGCLNDLGPKVAKYVSGQISDDEWAATCDCAIGSLDEFRKFVRGSGPPDTDPQGTGSGGRAYTQADISGLLANFLLTAYPENGKLVEAGFALKAAMLGGSTDLATSADLDALLKILRSVKTETLRLLPLIRRWADHPTRDELVQLAHEIPLSGTAIAASVGGGSQNVFSWQSAAELADEIGKATGQTLPDRLIDWVSAGKNLIFAGSALGVKGEEMAGVVELAAAYLGPAIAALKADTAALDGPNALNELYFSLADKVRPAIERTLELHHGAVSLADFDRVIDALPDVWVNIDRKILEKTLRPLVNSLLRSETANAFDGNSLQMLYSMAGDWVASQRIIDLIYEQDRKEAGDPAGMTPASFVRAANALGPSDPATLKQVSRLVYLAQFYRPLFEEGDSQIRFVKQTKLSHNQISILLWVRIAVEELMKSYSSVGTRDRITETDFKTFIDDYIDFTFALHLIDNSDPLAYKKRFQQANLFMFSSNGDDYMDMNEATYFIMYFYSGIHLSNRLLNSLGHECPSQGIDLLEFNWVTAGCFRNEFYGNYSDWWDHFPDLAKYYENLSPLKQQDMKVALEAGSRFFGYSEKNFASYDSGELIGLIHYVEGLFVRFDTNGDQFLDQNEVIAAYPVFKHGIAQLSGLNESDDNTIQAVFTYMFKYGEPPTTDPIGIAKLLIWELQKSSWSFKADRYTVYSVIAKMTALQNAGQ